MSPTEAGLIGAIIGAISAVAANVISHFFTKKRENERHSRELAAERNRWLREQKQNCYHNAVKYLIRVRSVGVKAKKSSHLFLPQDAPDSWYDDIAEANAWLSSLHFYCSAAEQDTVGEVSAQFFNLTSFLIRTPPTGTMVRDMYSHIVSDEGELNYENFVDEMNQIENAISNAGCREFHQHVAHADQARSNE